MASRRACALSDLVTQYSYDSVGNLVSTVRAVGDPDVRTLLARYDLQGRLTGELSAQGAFPAAITSSRRTAPMQNTLDRTPLCSCCHRERPFHVSDQAVNPPHGEAPASARSANAQLERVAACG